MILTGACALACALMAFLPGCVPQCFINPGACQAQSKGQGKSADKDAVCGDEAITGSQISRHRCLRRTADPVPQKGQPEPEKANPAGSRPFVPPAVNTQRTTATSASRFGVR